MRVLLYSRVFPPATGGMERFAEDLAAWLTARGHSVTVWTQTPSGRGLDGRRPFQIVRRGSPSKVWGAARAADVVHVNGLSVRGIGVASAAGRRPIVTHAGHQFICPTGLAWSPRGACTAGPGPGPCRACPEGDLRGAGKVKTHRLASRVSARNVCVSRYLTERMRPPRPTMIYNPVSGRAFAAQEGRSGEDGLVAFAGRLVEEKGLDLLLRALRRLPEVRLEVAGDGPMRRLWVALAQELGVAPRVRFLGSLPFEGVAELYARAAVVCVPSVWGEPFGYAAAEAMAMARPVVGTPAGALRELLGAGRGVVANTVSEEALARALNAALGDDAARRRAGDLARKFALSELSVDAIGPTYVQAYEEAAA